MSEVVRLAAVFVDAVKAGDEATVRAVLTSPAAAEVAVHLAEMLNESVEPVVVRDLVAVNQLVVARQANAVQSARIRDLEAKVAELRSIAEDRARRIGQGRVARPRAA